MSDAAVDVLVNFGTHGRNGERMVSECVIIHSAPSLLRSEARDGKEGIELIRTKIRVLNVLSELLKEKTVFGTVTECANEAERLKKEYEEREEGKEENEEEEGEEREELNDA